jgi:hypothetical protein
MDVVMNEAESPRPSKTHGVPHSFCDNLYGPGVVFRAFL